MFVGGLVVQVLDASYFCSFWSGFRLRPVRYKPKMPRPPAAIAASISQNTGVSWVPSWPVPVAGAWDGTPPPWPPVACVTEAGTISIRPGRPGMRCWKAWLRLKLPLTKRLLPFRFPLGASIERTRLALCFGLSEKVPQRTVLLEVTVAVPSDAVAAVTVAPEGRFTITVSFRLTGESPAPTWTVNKKWVPSCWLVAVQRRRTVPTGEVRLQVGGAAVVGAAVVAGVVGAAVVGAAVVGAAVVGTAVVAGMVLRLKALSREGF